jgi:hypothetical protein
MEAMHERSVMAVLAFQFTESEVGAYDELVMAVITPPMVVPGKPLPKAAFFPFMVATSTPESRAHAIERWRLPHHMADLDFDLDGDRRPHEARRFARAMRRFSSSRSPRTTSTSTTNPYHCFTVGESRRSGRPLQGQHLHGRAPLGARVRGGGR